MIIVLTGDTVEQIALTRVEMCRDKDNLWYKGWPEATRHPLEAVKHCKQLIEENKRDKDDYIITTFNPDVVSAIRYIGEKEGVETSFYIATDNPKEPIGYGNNIDPLFKSFNKAIDYIDEHGI